MMRSCDWQTEYNYHLVSFLYKVLSPSSIIFKKGKRKRNFDLRTFVTFRSTIQKGMIGQSGQREQCITRTKTITGWIVEGYGCLDSQRLRHCGTFSKDYNIERTK